MSFDGISWQEFIDLIKVTSPIILLLVPILLFRKNINNILIEIRKRLRSSSRINIVSKFASIEMDRTRVGPTGAYTGAKAEDTDKRRETQRRHLYEKSRGLELVHTISKSSREQQLFDIEIFIIPHKDSSMKGLSRVGYFFGSYWGNKIYQTENRFNGFLISTSAYGPFLCTAELHFNDGASVVLERYIDFEMGDFAPVSLIEHNDKKEK